MAYYNKVRTGGCRAVGTTASSALKIWRDVQQLASAGVRIAKHVRRE